MDLRQGLQPELVRKQNPYKEKLMHELAASNEQLEAENMKLRERLLVLGAAFRRCGCKNASQSLPFMPYLSEEVKASVGGPDWRQGRETGRGGAPEDAGPPAQQAVPSSAVQDSEAAWEGPEEPRGRDSNGPAAGARARPLFGSQGRS